MENTLNQNDIYVFLGPTLSVAEASKILPYANFLPPIKCGDLLHLLRLNPKVIAIIDGVFETEAAVWHKEILLCLEQNICIYGSSSMGALRAAELYDFGMIGVGDIFHNYLTGNLNDDDEVAILHTPGPEYETLTDAMVNIRATITQSIRQKIIDDYQGNFIVKKAKKLFYQERYFSKILSNIHYDEIKQPLICKLKNWISSGGYVDLKKIDAIELLKKISQIHKKPILKTIYLNKTIYLKALYKNKTCQPFYYYNENLPIAEKVSIAAHSLKEYPLILNLSYVLNSAYEFSISQSHHLVNNFQYIDIFKIKNLISNPTWDSINDISLEEKNIFLSKLSLIESLFNTLNINKFFFDNAIKENIISILMIRGEYVNYKNNISLFENSISFRILELISIFWLLFKITLKENNQLKPNKTVIEYYTNKFRKKYNLYSKKSILSWLNTNELNQNDFYCLMEFYTYFSFLILEGNMEIINVKSSFPSISTGIIDALRLSGAYSLAKATLYNG